MGTDGPDPVVGHLVIGPSTHGVVRCAVGVWQALTEAGPGHRIARMAQPEDDIPDSMRGCGWVHIHVTDRLFGPNPAGAAHALHEISERLGTRVSVTLHDIPQPSDGASMAARSAFYRTAASSARGLVVSSRHEATLLAQHVDTRLDPDIVPLMIEKYPFVRPDPSRTPTVGVLGFLYPGKGHIETARALRDLPTSVGFVALGTPSPGHEYLAAELGDESALSGRGCEITGFLDDSEMRRRIAGVTVPVAHHRHMSASGSINTWIAAGRRPLVPATPYTLELEARSPGSVLLHGDDDTSLRAAIAESLEDCSRTWRTSGADPFPSPAEVARQYSRLFRRWSR